MSLVSLPGQFAVPIGLNLNAYQGGPAAVTTLQDAANEACHMIGQVIWADGGSHTIDTTGSSSIGWRTGTVTFANAGTTFKVGIAAVDTSNGPPGRAVNVADVITFDVAAVFTGGGGGVTTTSWQTSVPTTGTKTIANGDLVAVCTQMTARAGADSVTTSTAGSSTTTNPSSTGFTGGAYTDAVGVPNVIITASDGTLGYIYAASVFSTISTRTWNSASATKEYGQLFSLPFPISVYGLYGWVTPTADFDVVLYSDPLGTPTAQKTFSFDANWVAAAGARKFSAAFASPYQVPPNTPIAAVFKPGASNISTAFKTLQSATHRIADPWGTSGYGISRASGAFADANSSLDHYFIGLLASAFDTGGGYPASRMRLGM